MTELTFKDACRLWQKIDVRGVDECWPWLASRNHGGYGTFRHNGKTVRVTRLMWALANGKEMPQGSYACHTCDNPACCNPHHIWEGNPLDNMRDCIAKGRRKVGSPTHCAKGHPYSEQGFVWLTSGKRKYRDCTRCKRERARRQYRRKVGRSVRSSQAGENNPNARLTTADVDLIRELDGRIPRAKIATKFQISTAHVSKILRGEKWKSRA